MRLILMQVIILILIIVSINIQLTDMNLPTVNKQNRDEEISNQQQQLHQQQYFAQNGINVMMSLSNATHVRLLNASLETEGIYACEISTQNLSTIRYEKNIRVYVLPNSKLNIIGFKNRYSLGDKVDVICSSDFSRPQPALAWFINGQLISNSDQRFELKSTNKRNKLNEPNLFGLNLGLKFKLTQELLAEFGAFKFGQQGQVGANLSVANIFNLPAKNQRNQSHKQNTNIANNNNTQKSIQQNNYQPLAVPSSAQLSPTTMNSASSPNYLHQFNQEQHRNHQFALRIQCKYKLAEVSDVTFNELIITQTNKPTLAGGSRERNKHFTSNHSLLNNLKKDSFASSSPSSNNRLRNSIQKRKLVTINGRSKRRKDKDNDDEDVDVDEEGAGAGLGKGEGEGYLGRRSGFNKVELLKSSTSHQILQTKHPADYKSILNFLNFKHRDENYEDQCKLGSLALYPDDPVLIETIQSNNSDENETTIPSTNSRAEDDSDILDEDNYNHQLDDSNSSRRRRRRRRRNIVDQYGDYNSYSEINKEGEEKEDMDGEEEGAQKRSIGDIISVNCSTITALYQYNKDFDLQEKQERQHFNEEKHYHREQQQRENKLGFCIEPQRRASLLAGIFVNRAGNQKQMEITGTTSSNTNEQQDGFQLLKDRNQGFSFSSWPNYQQQPTSTGFHMVVTNNNDNNYNYNNGRQRSFSSSFAYLSLDSPIMVANDGITTTADSSSANQPDMATTTLLAPPLLEWFINNQEAPASSISGYMPELPLLAIAGSPTASAPSSGQHQHTTSNDYEKKQLAIDGGPDSRILIQNIGASSMRKLNQTNQKQRQQQNFDFFIQPEMLPSIDSTEYFANFNSRSIGQSLVLTMKLNEKHFMTPDLKLRLRCSSTQAQVLMVDSATVTILPFYNNSIQQQNLGGGGGWQQRPIKSVNKLRGHFQTSRLSSSSAGVKDSQQGSSSSRVLLFPYYEYIVGGFILLSTTNQLISL